MRLGQYVAYRIVDDRKVIQFYSDQALELACQSL